MYDIKYIDTHSHIHFGEFDADREALFARMSEASLATIAVGTNLETSQQVVDMANTHPKFVVGCSIGVHPTDKEDFVVDEYKRLMDTGNVVAVGECGLDYFRSDESDFNRQKDLFIAQIEFAIDNRLPLMLHIRSRQGSNDAHKDAYYILKSFKKEFPELHLHMHFFTMDYETAKMFLELDASFGIPGVVTFACEVKEAALQIPIDKIVVETDAPYAAPVPHRGKRNEPLFIIDIIKYLSLAKNMSFEELSEIILENSKRVFNLRI